MTSSLRPPHSPPPTYLTLILIQFTFACSESSNDIASTSGEETAITAGTSSEGAEATGPATAVDGEENDMSESDADETGGEIPVSPAVIAAAGSHTCAIGESGGVYCWGSGRYGQLGYVGVDAVGDDETPADIGAINFKHPAVSVAAGFGSSCALLEDLSVQCWGWNAHGLLGSGELSPNDCYDENGYSCAVSRSCCVGDDESPADVPPVELGAQALQIVLGKFHACALVQGGDVVCWGMGSVLGWTEENAIGDDETPAQAGRVPLDSPAVELFAGANLGCARLESGLTKCWGLGGAAVLPPQDADAIVNIELGWPAQTVALGPRHACAHSGTGATKCWGQAVYGLLGRSDLDLETCHPDNCSGISDCCQGDDESLASIPVLRLPLDVAHISNGPSHSCALAEHGEVLCWGRNDRGQIGQPGIETLGDDEDLALARLLNLGGPAIGIATAELHSCAHLGSGRARCWGLNNRGRLGANLGLGACAAGIDCAQLPSECCVGDDEAVTDIREIALP